MRPARRRPAPLLLALLLSGYSSAGVKDDTPFASDRDAAVHFVKPLFPLMDCETVGAVSKGEVDDHFFALFYTFARLRSFSFEKSDTQRAFSDSSEEKVSTLFGMMDQNGNGVVSTGEFRDFMYTAMDLIDVEQKGRVTLTDLGLDEPRLIRAKQR